MGVNFIRIPKPGMILRYSGSSSTKPYTIVLIRFRSMCHRSTAAAYDEKDIRDQCKRCDLEIWTGMIIDSEDSNDANHQVFQTYDNFCATSTCFEEVKEDEINDRKD